LRRFNGVIEPNSGRGQRIIDSPCGESIFATGVPKSLVEPRSRALVSIAGSEILLLLFVYLLTVLEGCDSCQKNETIHQAITIGGDMVQVTPILKFQNREPDYPHAYINSVVNSVPKKVA